MMIEMFIGLFIFAMLFLSVIQFLIRQRSEKVKQQRIKTLAEFKTRREEVERKTRREL